jgi:hypothetical protein
MVTVVTVFSVAVVVSKTSSPSSRPTRERRKSQWGRLAGGDFREEIQPEPIDFCSRITLDSGGMATPFLLPNGECEKFRLAVRPPFSKGDEHWGCSAEHGAKHHTAASRAIPSESAIASFDGLRLSKVLLRYF